jgi:hypothetical protein
LIFRNLPSKVKNPGPKDQDLVIPRGDLVCRQLTIYGVLEYWSGGVMEEIPFFHRSQKTDPWRKSENLKLFFLNQHSSTLVDLYGQSPRTLTGPKDQVFQSEIKLTAEEPVFTSDRGFIRRAGIHFLSKNAA